MKTPEAIQKLRNTKAVPLSGQRKSFDRSCSAFRNGLPEGGLLDRSITFSRCSELTLLVSVFLGIEPCDTLQASFRPSSPRPAPLQRGGGRICPFGLVQRDCRATKEA